MTETPLGVSVQREEFPTERAIKHDDPKLFQSFLKLLGQPLHRAIQGCATNTVIYLLKSHSDSDLEEIDLESGLTPMGLACRHNLAEVVSLLLRKGVDINGWCGHGKRPVHEAVQYGHLEVLKELRRLGAGMNTVSRADAN